MFPIVMVLFGVLAPGVRGEEEGWRDLLAEAGPGMAGWTRVAIPPTDPLKEFNPWLYDPATGVLRCAGEKGGHEWLRYDKEVSDGVLRVEWRFVPAEGAAGKYNSGMYARNSRDGTIWHQAQMGDGSGGFLFGQTRVGGELRRLNLSKESKPGLVKPAGEWNSFELTFRGRTMTLEVNGEKCCAWEDCEEGSGYIGLEAEGYRIEFRNVKLKTP